MAATVQAFRARFPEYSDLTDYPDARIQLFLDDAVGYIGVDELRWCNKYDSAHAYLAAHLLDSGEKTAGGDTSASTGPISQKSAGGLSVTRAVTTKDRSDTDDFYMSTAYGQRFIVIRNSCFVGVLVANAV